MATGASRFSLPLPLAAPARERSCDFPRAPGPMRLTGEGGRSASVRIPPSGPFLPSTALVGRSNRSPGEGVFFFCAPFLLFLRLFLLARSQRGMDSGENGVPYCAIFLACSLAVWALELYIDLRQRRRLGEKKLPDEVVVASCQVCNIHAGTKEGRGLREEGRGADRART